MTVKNDAGGLNYVTPRHRGAKRWRASIRAQQKAIGLAERGRKMPMGRYELDPGDQRGAGRCTGRPKVDHRGRRVVLGVLEHLGLAGTMR